MKQQQPYRRQPADRLEDIIDQLGQLYAEADRILDSYIAEAYERKLASGANGKLPN
jgi:hypothetical protein